MPVPNFYGLAVLRKGEQSVPESLPELHLNIWETDRLFAPKSTFFDIGLMLDLRDQATSFEFVFPWKLSGDDFEDLTPRLEKAGAIPAVFNESWSCTNTNNTGTYVIVDEARNDFFTMVQIDTKDRTVTSSDEGVSLLSLDIEKIKNTSKSIKLEASKMYVRFRIKKIPQDFYRVSINAKDRFFLSSWQGTEVIDFRINVKRGIPVGFEHKFGGKFVSFKKIHLFLMKSRDQDLVFEDKYFKSCRSLEDEIFWADYSMPKNSFAWNRWFNQRRVKNSLGYQWTKAIGPIVSPNNAAPQLIEFGTLARFKVVRFRVLQFIIAAALVGALGNLVWDAIKFRYEKTPLANTILDWISTKPEKGSK